MDEQHLIDAIYLDPGDDDALRVYADWLEEHGQDDRAAQIRAQIEFDRLPRHDPRRKQSASEEERLRKRCLAALPLKPALRKKLELSLSRGLVEASILDGAELTEADFLALAAVPTLKTLKGIRALTADRIALLSLCPNVQQLEEYCYRGSSRKLAVEDWDAIAALPHIDALRLDGDGRDDHDEVVGRIASIRSLREFSLNFGGVRDSTIPHLARLERLEVLRIHGSPAEDWPGITDAGLAGLTGLKRLKELDLSGTAITDAGLPLLLKFPRLVSLDLSYIEGITGDPVPVLAQLKHLRTLRLCSLRGVDDSNIQELARRLPRLRELDLSRTSVTRVRLIQLLPKTKWRKLHLEASMAVLETREEREVTAFEKLCEEHDVFVEIDYE